MIPELPYLAPWYRIASADDAVVLEYGQRIICLAGRAGAVLVPVLLPLLDGTRTLDEIVEVLGEPARPAIEAALERLDEHDLLLDGPPLPRRAPAALGHRPAPRLASARRSSRLARLPVRSRLAVRRRRRQRRGRSRGCPPVAAERRRVRRGRDDLGGRRSRRLRACPGGAARTRRMEQPGAWPRGRPWLQVLPFDGRYASIGPLYLPDETCCFECFRLRRAANLEAADELELLEATPAAYPALRPCRRSSPGSRRPWRFEWLVLRDHDVPAAFYAVELGPVLALSLHHVHRVPRCPVCSGLEDVAAPLPWYKEHAVVGD